MLLRFVRLERPVRSPQQRDLDLKAIPYSQRRLNVSENVEQPMTEPQESADVYYDADRIFSISSIANILSWFFLVFAILFLIPFFVQLFSIPEFSFQLLLSILSDIVLNLSLSIVLLFFYVFLRAISEGLLVLLEIEENTRGN
jgi:hypothetical protein